MKKLLLIAVSALFVVGCSKVDQVKSGTFNAYPNTTIGKAFDTSFGNAEWTDGETAKGEIFVEMNALIDEEFLIELAKIIYRDERYQHFQENVSINELVAEQFLKNPNELYGNYDKLSVVEASRPITCSLLDEAYPNYAPFCLEINEASLFLGHFKAIEPNYKYQSLSKFKYYVSSYPSLDEKIALTLAALPNPGSTITVQFDLSNGGDSFTLGYYGIKGGFPINKYMSEEEFLDFVYSSHAYKKSLFVEKPNDALNYSTKGSIKDSRDGKEYKVVTLLNGQTWMAENLDYKNEDSYCPQKGCAEGRMYLYNDSINICPDGFELPNGADLQNLKIYLRKSFGISKDSIAYGLMAENAWPVKTSDLIGFALKPTGDCKRRFELVLNEAEWAYDQVFKGISCEKSESYAGFWLKQKGSLVELLQKAYIEASFFNKNEYSLHDGDGGNFTNIRSIRCIRK